MKALRSTLLLALAAVAAGALPARQLAAQKPAPKTRIERGYAVAGDMSLRLYGAITVLRIIGWNRDSLLITGTMPKGWRMDGGAGTSPGGQSRGAKFFVEAPTDVYPVGAVLEVRVPQRARVWAKSGSAEIAVSGVAGGLDLNIVGGSITVSDRPQQLNIESMDGAVKVLGGAGWLRVKTATGDIDVRGGSEDAGLSTVSGTIRLDTGRYERGKFETVTGDIVYAADMGARGTLDLNTHSGRIELRVPPSPNADLDLMTVTGAIENGLGAGRAIPGREGRGMELGVSLGTGDTRVVARSFKGNIILKAR